MPPVLSEMSAIRALSPVPANGAVAPGGDGAAANPFGELLALFEAIESSTGLQLPSLVPPTGPAAPEAKAVMSEDAAETAEDGQMAPVPAELIVTVAGPLPAAPAGPEPSLPMPTVTTAVSVTDNPTEADPLLASAEPDLSALPAPTPVAQAPRPDAGPVPFGANQPPADPIGPAAGAAAGGAADPTVTVAAKPKLPIDNGAAVDVTPPENPEAGEPQATKAIESPAHATINEKKPLELNEKRPVELLRATTAQHKEPTPAAMRQETVARVEVPAPQAEAPTPRVKNEQPADRVPQASANPAQPDSDAGEMTFQPRATPTTGEATANLASAVAASANTAPASSQPAQAQPPAVQPPALAQAVPVAGLAVEIAAQARDGKNRFEIRLDPPELGRIDVRLEVDTDGQVSSHLRVDRPETLDLLRRDAPALERALQQAGLRTSDSGLQFSLRDHGFSQREQEQQRAAAAHVVIPDENLSVETQRHYARLAGTGSGVDIRV